MIFSKDKRIRSNIELVSIHIPKTAGTSFRNMLKDIYGEEKVVRLDINEYNKSIRIEEEHFNKSKISRRIKIVHGHFFYNTFNDLFKVKEDVKWLTWLRHPVERVISNYYYLQKRLKEELDEESKGLNILDKMQKSLLEYASNEISRNRMAKFLNGADLNKFYFVGIQEFYDDDLKYFCQLEEIELKNQYFDNKTGLKKEVDKSIKKEIEKLNQLDMVIYNQALELRNKRMH